MDLNVILFDQFESLDIFGPVEVFGNVEELKLCYLSETGGLIASRHGFSVLTEAMNSAHAGVLVVPGGPGTRTLACRQDFLHDLRLLSDRSEWCLSVCTGSVLYAQCGALNGRRATSNKRAWEWVVKQTAGSGVNWVQRARWVVDGKFYTSSGVSAGLDMALGFVCDRWGEELAGSIARRIEYRWNSDPADRSICLPIVSINKKECCRMPCNRDDLKARLYNAIDARADELKAFAMDLHRHPEHGFFERRTSDKLAEALGKLGLQVRRGLARTGMRVDFPGSASGPRVGILGELDGLTCPNYPEADKTTGASHTCGHDMQTTMVLAVASALFDTGAMKELAGSVALFGVPAEEFIQIGEREKLRAAGEISFLGGKQEMIKIGAFDDIDLSMMIHAHECPGFTLPSTCNGFRGFTVHYKGVQAHAAGAPDKGINALYAAVAGINAVNALRETFRDDDCVRVHFIITKGGAAVNSVPDDVQLEGYVRAKNVDCISMVYDKVVRAFLSGGTALGAEAVVESIPGYLPLRCDEEFGKVFAANARALPGNPPVTPEPHGAGSTDMGDVTHIMPAIHAYVGGAKGPFHSASYRILNLDQLVIQSSKALCGTLVDLCADGAEKAKKIVADFKPAFSRSEYIALLNSWFQTAHNDIHIDD